MAYKKRVIVGSFAAVVAAGAIGVSVTSAHFSDNAGKRSSVRSAIERNNFTAFQHATKDLPFASKVDTQKEFDAITLAHSLRQDNKYKEAREVLERAGIEHPGHGQMHGPRADVRSALEHDDWAEFQQATKDKRIGNIINTENKFYKMVEAHELHEDGRHDEAREMMHGFGMRGHHMR